MPDCSGCGQKLPEGFPPGGLCPSCVLRGSTVELDAGPRDTVPAADVQEGPFGPSANFGPYRIISEMGRGGMGVVYKAVEVSLARQVALKVLLAGERATVEQAARFVREARSAASLSHPNIVPVYSAGMEKGVPYFAMEFIEGTSLEAVARTPMNPVEAALLLRDVALALQYSHEKGIVHRDVKPANILVDPQGKPRITDFGLAKLMGDQKHLTQEGTALGTPAYMSPEQAAGATGTVGPLSDVYSLGAVFYEALTGRPPFLAETPLQLMAMIQSEFPAPLSRHRPGIAPDFQTVCFKALEKKPELRYASMADFAEDLRRVAEGLPILAKPPSLLRRAGSFASRSRTRIAIGFLTAMLAAAAAALAVLVAGARAERDNPGGPGFVPAPPAAPRGDSRAAALRMDIGRELLERADKTFLLENPKNRRKLLEEALSAFTEAAEADPWMAEAFLEKGRALMHLEDYEKALKAFDRATELNPDLTDAYYGRVQIRYKQYFQAWLIGGRAKSREIRSRIEADLASIDRIGAKPEKSLCGRAVLLVLDGKRAEAIQAVNEAIEANDAFADAYSARGTIVVSNAKAKTDKAEIEKALEDFTIATRLSGGSSEYRANRAQTLLTLGRLPEALAEADAIVSMLPEKPFPYLLRAQILKALGDEAGYDRDMDLADTLPLDNPDIHIAVAGMLMNRAFQAGGVSDLRVKDVERVLSHLDRFVERFPERRDVLGIRGIGLMLLGRRGDAMEDLKLYLKEFPDSQLAPAFRTALLMMQAGARFEIGSVQELSEAAARHLEAGREEEAEFFTRRIVASIEGKEGAEPREQRYRRALCKAHLDLALILSNRALKTVAPEEKASAMAEALEHATKAVKAGGPGVRRLVDDGAFKALRADPGFVAVAALLKERGDERGPGRRNQERD